MKVFFLCKLCGARGKEEGEVEEFELCDTRFFMHGYVCGKCGSITFDEVAKNEAPDHLDGGEDWVQFTAPPAVTFSATALIKEAI